jgi:hypothetical protein
MPFVQRYTRQRETERDRERHRETERDRKRQKETERDRERQRETERDRERQREREEVGHRLRTGSASPYAVCMIRARGAAAVADAAVVVVVGGGGRLKTVWEVTHRGWYYRRRGRWGEVYLIKRRDSEQQHAGIPVAISRESVCCLLVLNLVSSTPPCIRQPGSRKFHFIGCRVFYLMES